MVFRPSSWCGRYVTSALYFDRIIGWGRVCGITCIKMTRGPQCAGIRSSVHKYSIINYEGVVTGAWVQLLQENNHFGWFLLHPSALNLIRHECRHYTGFTPTILLQPNHNTNARAINTPNVIGRPENNQCKLFGLKSCPSPLTPTSSNWGCSDPLQDRHTFAET